MMNEAAITWPAGFGYVPGKPTGAAEEGTRRQPDKRYQRAYTFLIQRPRWVSNNLPETMIVDALNEKFKQTKHDCRELIADVRESIALGISVADISPETTRLPANQRFDDLGIVDVMQNVDLYRGMTRTKGAERLRETYGMSMKTAFSAIATVLGRTR